MDTRTARRIGRRLVKWYGENARDLPWRREPTPYSVWVSEAMLQQTVVATVIPYFTRWMARFPDVASLAAASEREVLSLWQGMGYYRRAQNLHRAAQAIVREHGGEVPRSRDGLLALPGIGPYMASAIRSIAFGEDEVALDANLFRVFMRLLCVEGRGTEAAVRAQVEPVAEAALPAGRSSDYNQALMDFGSLVCRPRNPACGECFLRRDCAAFAQGEQYDIPTPVKRRLKKIRTAVAVFLREAPAGLEVYIQKRPPDGLFAGMWEFPGGKVGEGETPKRAVVRECREELGVGCRVVRKLTELTHYYTVFEVRLHAYECASDSQLPEDPTHCWVRLSELGSYPMPSANRAVLGELQEGD
jgi:A/G-specific adenine glycosylase